MLERRPYPAEPVPDDGPRRVLIVEDEETMRALLCEALSAAGYRTVCAPDGAVALSLLREGLCGPPDVILLDLKMPYLDGPGFVWRYRAAAARHVPVVVVTGVDGAAAYANLLGAVAAIAKPFDVDEVVDVVGRVIRREGVTLAPEAEARRLVAMYVAWCGGRPRTV